MDKPVEEAPEDEIKKIKQTAGAIQKAQGMMKPMYSSEIAALVEDEFEAVREAALRRYKKAKGKIDLYTAYTMAIEDEFPEIPNPIFVFQYMTDPIPDHEDLVPQEAEDGSWADRADKDYQQKAKSISKGTGFDPLIKGRWFAIKADRDSYMDQGMEPEDALEKAAERHGVDPEEVEKWIAAGNATKIKEAKMSKSSIKSIHKTADKIKDKPKAKKSISNWAKERGMDPEGAIYAIATNMKKRKQGKKITGLGKESYTREELPQITKTDLKYIPHHMETVEVASLVPVQKERIKENHTAQLLKILEGRFNPIVVDCYNRIVNGHHRYDVVKMLKMENITVVKLPFTLEFLLEGNLIPNPQRSVLVKKDDGYDHYKLATHIANIKKMSPRVAKRNKQDIFVQFYGGEKEKEYMMKNLRRLGFGVQDADGYRDGHFDENIDGGYVLKINLENFADGKKKGKSRPGRVKRSGASCKGSVTSLRSKAKKASGERAKMYHWCANMKSGRNK